MDSTFDYDKIKGLSNSLGGRVDLLEKMLGVKVRENLRYSDIQKIVKSGFADEFFDIGDEIMTTYTATDGTAYDFPWIVADFRDVYWRDDPNPHPGMVLQAKYATLETVPFDEAEAILVNSETEQTAQEGWFYFYKTGVMTYHALDLNTGDNIPFGTYNNIYKCSFNSTSIIEGGYNNYGMSAIRQWLNSDADVNEWWTPAHNGDVAPAMLSSVKGFLAGFISDFLYVIKPIKVSYCHAGNVESVYDKFFLPSYKELYGININDATDAEGPYFEYWKEKSGFSSPNNSSTSGRIVTTVTGQTIVPACWTRTSGKTIGKIQFCLGMSNGVLNDGGDADVDTFYSLPCCVIS